MGEAQQANKYQKTSTKRSTRPASKQDKEGQWRPRPRPSSSSSRWALSVSWVGLCKKIFCNVCCLFVCLVSSHEPQLIQICSKGTKSAKLSKAQKARFQHFLTFPGFCPLFLVSWDLESKKTWKVCQKFSNAVKGRLTFCWCSSAKPQACHLRPYSASGWAGEPPAKLLQPAPFYRPAWLLTRFIVR